MNTSINGESSGRTVISEGLDMELDGRFAIRERLLIAVAFTHYNTLQPEGVGHITVGVLLHDDLEFPIHSCYEVYHGPLQTFFHGSNGQSKMGIMLVEKSLVSAPADNNHISLQPRGNAQMLDPFEREVGRLLDQLLSSLIKTPSVSTLVASADPYALLRADIQSCVRLSNNWTASGIQFFQCRIFILKLGSVRGFSDRMSGGAWAVVGMSPAGSVSKRETQVFELSPQYCLAGSPTKQ